MTFTKIVTPSRVRLIKRVFIALLAMASAYLSYERQARKEIEQSDPHSDTAMVVK